MGLERIHLYYLVRILRVVVPLLVVVFASLFAWYYLGRAGSGLPTAPETRLQEDMSAETEGLRFSQGRDGCDLFTVDAVRSLGFEGGRNQLEGVELTLGGECANTPERRIRADHCGVQQTGDSLDVTCDGSVEIDLDASTTARTERLHYNHESETVTSDAGILISRPGEFELRAEAMHVGFRDKLFRFDGGVSVIREDGSHLEAGQLFYDEASGHVTAIGNLRLSSLSMVLAGARGDAWLLPETFAVSRIEVRGDVVVLSLSSDDGDRSERLTAEELDVDLGSTERTEVRARGVVRVESGPAGRRQTLEGDAVSAVLDPAGVIQSFESNGSAKMTLETGQTISSQTIRQAAGGALETGQDSQLEADDLTIRGNDFTIERGTALSFSTDEPASIDSPAGAFEGNTTRAEVNPVSGTLERLEQTGSVRFGFDGRKGSTEHLVIDALLIEMTGGARFEDSDFTLEGDRIGLARADDSLDADGNIFLTINRESLPVFVEGDHLEGRPRDLLKFTGSVVLRRMGSQVRAARVDLDQAGGSFSAEGDVQSTMDDIIVSSEALRFDDASGHIEYFGSVRARADDLIVDSEALDILMGDGAVDRIDARGDVRVVSSDGIEGSGATARYLRPDGSVTLSGPGAEATDPARGHCRGDEIVVDIRTHDIRVGSQGQTPTLCSPPVSSDAGVPGGRIREAS